MKKIPRPYLYLIIVVIVAALVWFLEKPTEEKTGDILNKVFLPELNTKDVAMIEIEHLLNSVKLKKEEGEWKVTNFKTKLKENLETSEAKDKKPPSPLAEEWHKADSGKVDLSLDTLLDVQLISLAGDNPEKHGFFEVTPVGMQLRLYDKDGKKLAHIYLGKTGAGFLESYVRKEGENEVYLANRYLRATFSPDVDSWIKK